jgi:choice-of-anchor A domain-containing protein
MQLFMRTRFGFVGTLIVGLAASSWAGGGPLGNAGSFNAFIFDQATLNGGGESEGAIAVGGLGVASNQNALTSTGNYNTLIKPNPANLGSLNNIGLYVNGNASFTSGGQLNNGGNAYISGNFSTGNPYDMNGAGSFNYGGTLTGNVQGAGSVNHTNLVNSSYFTQQQTYSQQQSAALSALTANATVNTNTANNWTVTYNGGVQNNKTYVVDLTAANLAGYGGNAVTLNLNGLNSTDSLIFDVSGSILNNFGISIQNANGLQKNILWNFGNATTVDINNRQLEGSVLAYNATVNQSTVIEGTLIAKNWDMTGGVEMHSYNFSGGNTPIPTPEPGPFMVLGLGVVGVLVKRKKK